MYAITPMGWVTIIGLAFLLISLIVDNIAHGRGSPARTLADVLTISGFVLFVVGVGHYLLLS